MTGSLLLVGATIWSWVSGRLRRGLREVGLAWQELQQGGIPDQELGSLSLARARVSTLRVDSPNQWENILRKFTPSAEPTVQFSQAHRYGVLCMYFLSFLRLGEVGKSVRMYEWNTHANVTYRGNSEWLVDPQFGFNASNRFSPGDFALSRCQIKPTGIPR